MEHVVIIDGVKYVPETCIKKEEDTFDYDILYLTTNDLGNLKDLEYNNMYKYDALITSLNNHTVVILPLDILNLFSYNDWIPVGIDKLTNVCPFWGGNTIGPMQGEISQSGTLSGKEKLRMSRCSYFNSIDYGGGNDIINQVKRMLLEAKHRKFQGGDLRGKGFTYGDKNCGCEVCSKFVRV